MPLYEYACEQCGERFEVMQKFTDQPLTTHEKCGGRVQRLISAPAFQFKGSGWYVTDYAKAGNSSGDKSSEKSSDNGAPAKTDGTTGSTPAKSDAPAASSSSSESKPSKSTSSETKSSS